MWQRFLPREHQRGYADARRHCILLTMTRQPSFLKQTISFRPANSFCLQQTLQVSPFIFNHFDDAPPATTLLSTFCFVAGGGPFWWLSTGSVATTLRPASPLECAVEHPMKDLNVHVSPLECAVPQNARLTPLECALTKMALCKSFRMRSYEKKWGGGAMPPSVHHRRDLLYLKSPYAFRVLILILILTSLLRCFLTSPPESPC